MQGAAGTSSAPRVTRGSPVTSSATSSASSAALHDPHSSAPDAMSIAPVDTHAEPATTNAASEEFGYLTVYGTGGKFAPSEPLGMEARTDMGEVEGSSSAFLKSRRKEAATEMQTRDLLGYTLLPWKLKQTVCELLVHLLHSIVRHRMLTNRVCEVTIAHTTCLMAPVRRCHCGRCGVPTTVVFTWSCAGARSWDSRLWCSQCSGAWEEWTSEVS